MSWSKPLDVVFVPAKGKPIQTLWPTRALPSDTAPRNKTKKVLPWHEGTILNWVQWSISAKTTKRTRDIPRLSTGVYTDERN